MTTVDPLTAVGVLVATAATDAIYVVTGEHAMRRAELLANQLPHLRELSA